MASEDLTLRMRALGARETSRESERVARSIDNIGDQASQAARKLARMNAAQARTRVSLGPFSTSMRFATVAVGGFILAASKAVPFTLALAEGIGTAGAAAGGAGLAGLTAFKQATTVAKLGAADLTAALGGNKQAFQRLTPEARRLYNTLTAAQDQLKQTAGKGLLPGLEVGTRSAMRNLPVINRIVGDTSKTLGGLASSAGAKLGSKSWGRDLSDIGKQNTVVIDNLGRAGIHLAGGFKDIVHEAEPLAVWLSQAALRGSKLTETWLGNARASGRMSRFFREGRRDLTELASITGHLTGGVLNLFGAQDVNGTKTLANLDRITAQFERWTRTLIGKPLGPELEKQLGIALGHIAGFIGSHLGTAGVTAATAFWTAFKNAGIWGQGITAVWLATKFGLTKGVLGGLGKLVAGGAAGGGGLGRGISRAAPVPVFVTNWGGAGGGIPRGVGGAVGGAGALDAAGVAGAGTIAAGIGTAGLIGAGIAAYRGPRFLSGSPGQDSRGVAQAKADRQVMETPAARSGALLTHHGAATAAGGGGFPWLPVIIQLDGKTIATATARAAARKRAIR